MHDPQCTENFHESLGTSSSLSQPPASQQILHDDIHYRHIIKASA